MCDLKHFIEAKETRAAQNTNFVSIRPSDPKREAEHEDFKYVVRSIFGKTPLCDEEHLETV